MTLPSYNYTPSSTNLNEHATQLTYEIGDHDIAYVFASNDIRTAFLNFIFNNIKVSNQSEKGIWCLTYIIFFWKYVVQVYPIQCMERIILDLSDA